MAYFWKLLASVYLFLFLSDVISSMVVQPTETMNTQTDVTIITEVVTALEGTDKDKSMKSSSMDADTAGKLTEETMTSKPAIRIETSASFMNTNESPTATNESPMATNKLPTATNESPMATNESPMAINELPTATNESPMATNEFSMATNEFSMATNESPMATNELPMTTNESPMATNESPMDISLSSLAILTIDTTDETFTMEVTKAAPEDDAEVTTVDLVKDVTDEDVIEHVVTTEPAHVIETTLVYAPTSRDTRTTGAPMLLHTSLVPETTSSMMTTSEVSTTADVTTRDTTTGESTTDNVYGETETPDNSTALIEDKTIASIRVAISIYGEEFDEALTDTSTIEFTRAALNWKERIEYAFCNASSGIWNDTCPITAEVPGISLDPSTIHTVLDIIHVNEDIVSALTEFILDNINISILDEMGNAYNITISSLTLITEAPDTASKGIQNLTCHVCSTDDSDATDFCYAGGMLLTLEGSTEMCMVGESCLTLKTSNITHTSIVRQCASTAMYCDNADMPSMSCKHAQPTGGIHMSECHRCCSTDYCNQDAGSSDCRPIPSLLLLLATIFMTLAI